MATLRRIRGGRHGTGSYVGVSINTSRPRQESGDGLSMPCSVAGLCCCAPPSPGGKVMGRSREGASHGGGDRGVWPCVLHTLATACRSELYSQIGGRTLYYAGLTVAA